MFDNYKTISVPEKIYTLIKNTANQKNCSMSKLVSKAILEKLKGESYPKVTQTASNRLIIEIKLDKN